MYHSIVIEESLKDKIILEKYKIVRTKIGDKWHLHVIELEDPECFINDIQENMVSDEPYYFHIYNNESYLKVIFKHKVFNLDPKDKSTWIKAQNYGAEKLNIPAEELNFIPNNFKQENDWFNIK